MVYQPPKQIPIPHNEAQAQEHFDENEHNKDIYILHLHKKLDKLENELKERDELINSLYTQIKNYDKNFVIRDGLYESIAKILKLNKKEEKKVNMLIKPQSTIKKDYKLSTEINRKERKKYQEQEKKENKNNKRVVKTNQMPLLEPMMRNGSPIFARKKIECFHDRLQKKNENKFQNFNKNDCFTKTSIKMDDNYLDIDSMNYEDLLELEEKIGKVNRGLNESKIKKIDTNKYSKKKYKEQDECPICKEMYQEDEVIKELYCGHIYHTQCIERWLQQEKKCPCCNTEICI